VTKKTHATQDKDVPHNMGKSDMVRASDFNFLTVLGKGSFGKVRFDFLKKIQLTKSIIF
jgi:classical protein kinase C